MDAPTASEAQSGRVSSVSIGPLTASASNVSQCPSATACRSVFGSFPGCESHCHAHSGTSAAYTTKHSPNTSSALGAGKRGAFSVAANNAASASRSCAIPQSCVSATGSVNA